MIRVYCLCQRILLPAVDSHVHIDQVHEWYYAGGQKAGPMNVVIHVVWINPVYVYNCPFAFVLGLARHREEFNILLLPEVCYIVHDKARCQVGLVVF